ncbi:MAG: hypothetical protein AAFO04_30025 [Cyanobacteria bacterium J06592_8]
MINFLLGSTIQRNPNPNAWQILHTEADFDPLGTVSINVLISRAKKEIDHKIKYPAVFPIFGNLYRIGMNWVSDQEESLPAADNLQRVITFEVKGTTQGYFLDRIPFNSQTQQFEPDPDKLFTEIRAGHFEWKEDELGNIRPSQINYRDLPVITVNTEIRRAIGVKLLLKKKGYKHERTLAVETEKTDRATRVKRTNIFVPFYNNDDEVQDIDISTSIWVSQ